MKNKIQRLWIIVLVAMIGFSLVVCDDASNGNGTNNNGGNNSNSNDNNSNNSNGNNSGSGDNNSNSNGNNSGSGTTTKPSPPTEINATILSKNSIRITWNAVSGATSYQVYYGTPGNSDPVLSRNVTGTSWDYTSLTSGTYYFKVSAKNSAGEGTASSIISAVLAKPNTPTNIAASALSSNSIQISWSASGSGGTPSKYNIYRSTSSSSGYSLISSVNVPATSYTNTGLTTGTTYYYLVSSENPVGESDRSSYVSATPTAPVPNAPTGVKAVQRDPPYRAYMNVTWNSVAGATKYEVQWSWTGSSWSDDGETSSTTFVSGPYQLNQYNTTVYFRVRAYNSGGWGPWSSTSSGILYP